MQTDDDLQMSFARIPFRSLFVWWMPNRRLDAMTKLFSAPIIEIPWEKHGALPRTNWVVIEFHVGSRYTKWLKKRSKLADCSVRRSSHVRRTTKKWAQTIDKFWSHNQFSRNATNYFILHDFLWRLLLLHIFHVLFVFHPRINWTAKTPSGEFLPTTAKNYIIFPSKCGADTISACLYSEACVRHLCQPLTQQSFTDSRFYRLEIGFRGPFSAAAEMCIQIE